MPESTITSKGQTTVPADIRAFVHAKPGTRLVWSEMPDGTIIVRAKTKSVRDMAGLMTSAGRWPACSGPARGSNSSHTTSAASGTEPLCVAGNTTPTFGALPSFVTVRALPNAYA